MKSETGAEVAMYQRILTSSTTLRLLVAGLFIFMCFMQMVASYRGLDQPVVMDQAQVARELANGNGFTTKFLRPKLLENKAGRKMESLDLDHIKDTVHAPLNICAMAVGLKITGYSNFDAHLMAGAGSAGDAQKNDEKDGDKEKEDKGAKEKEEYASYIYGGDIVISSVSMFFFAVAVFLTYLLGKRMFDELVGACSATFMIFCSLMLDYAVSGLPQMLMMCCILGSVHFLLSAVRHNEGHHSAQVLLYVSLSYVCITLLCLTGWMGIWCAVGLIVFAGMYFRPFGAYALPGFIILSLGLLFPIAGNLAETHRMVGDAFFGIYDGLGSGATTADTVMRSTGTDNQDLESANIILRILGHACSQFSGMYTNMGAIIVAPFFFLALLNRYKKPMVEGAKWAVFSMWCFGCLGMSLYGVDTPFNPSQLGIIFAPFFTIYGITLVFNFIARYKLSSGQFTAARGLAMFFMILISAGPLLASIPSDLWNGFRFRAYNNQTPTYVPPVLNGKLREMVQPEGIVITDQPWAVAWYANRKALWTPLKASSYRDVIEPIVQNAQVTMGPDGKSVRRPYLQGFLFTPLTTYPSQRDATTSRVKREKSLLLGGLAEVSRSAGDFYILATGQSIPKWRDLPETHPLKDLSEHNLSPAASLWQSMTYYEFDNVPHESGNQGN